MPILQYGAVVTSFPRSIEMQSPDSTSDSAHKKDLPSFCTFCRLETNTKYNLDVKIFFTGEVSMTYVPKSV